MSSNYTGDDTATQAPSPLPAKNANPIVTLPSDGDPLTAGSIEQAMKALADGIDFVFDRALILDVPNTASAPQTFEPDNASYGDGDPAIVLSGQISGGGVYHLLRTEQEKNATIKTRWYVGTDGSRSMTINAAWDPAGVQWAADDAGQLAIRWRWQATTARWFIDHHAAAASWADAGWTTAQLDFDAALGKFIVAGNVEAGAEVKAATKVVVANTSLDYGTGSATVDEVTGNAGKAISKTVYGSCQTTDDATWITAITIPMPDDAAVHLETRLVAIDSVFGAGAIEGNVDGYRRTAGVTNQIPVPPAPAVYTGADQIGLTAWEWHVDAANLIFRVKGKAATTVNWMVKAEVMTIG